MSKKTSTTEEVQQIDPAMRAESEAQMDLARLIASWGFTPYQGATKADMTDATRASHAGVNDMAAAFGMETAESGVPMGEEDASGIRSWSAQKMAEKTEGYDDIMARIKAFAAAAGTPTPGRYDKPEDLSGGKK